MELVKQGEVLHGYKASVWLKRDLRPEIAQRESLWTFVNSENLNPYNVHNRPEARVCVMP